MAPDYDWVRFREGPQCESGGIDGGEPIRLGTKRDAIRLLIVATAKSVRRSRMDAGRRSWHGLLGHGRFALDQESEAGNAAPDPDLVSVGEQSRRVEVRNGFAS